MDHFPGVLPSQQGKQLKKKKKKKTIQKAKQNQNLKTAREAGTSLTHMKQHSSFILT